MDEIFRRKRIIKKVKNVLIYMFLFAFLMSTVLPGNNKLSSKILDSLEFVIYICIPILIIILIRFIFYALPYKMFTIESIVKNTDYNRIIPQECSPAIASLLYELKIDVYRDYSATILNLCSKKYIRFINDKTNYRFEILKNNANDLLNLDEHEQYVFACIKRDVRFDSKKFKNLIIQDAQAYGYIIEKKHNKLDKLQKLLWFIVFICFFHYDFYFFPAFYLLIIAIYLIKFFVKIDTLKRTEKGNELTIQITSLKNFIKDYTLMDEKEIGHIETLDEYIPYAIALDQANTIDKFLKSNSDYRELIYRMRT